MSIGAVTLVNSYLFSRFPAEEENGKETARLLMERFDTEKGSIAPSDLDIFFEKRTLVWRVLIERGYIYESGNLAPRFDESFSLGGLITPLEEKKLLGLLREAEDNRKIAVLNFLDEHRSPAVVGFFIRVSKDNRYRDRVRKKAEELLLKDHSPVEVVERPKTYWEKYIRSFEVKLSLVLVANLGFDVNPKIVDLPESLRWCTTDGCICPNRNDEAEFMGPFSMALPSEVDLLAYSTVGVRWAPYTARFFPNPTFGAPRYLTGPYFNRVYTYYQLSLDPAHFHLLLHLPEVPLKRGDRTRLFSEVTFNPFGQDIYFEGGIKETGSVYQAQIDQRIARLRQLNSNTGFIFTLSRIKGKWFDYELNYRIYFHYGRSFLDSDYPGMGLNTGNSWGIGNGLSLQRAVW